MVALVVLAGYLLVLGGTSVGQGWRLLAHVASAHAPASPASPEVYGEAPLGLAPTMTTLRPHRGDGSTHAHGHPHTHGNRPGFREAVRAEAGTPRGFHDEGFHDGGFHAHDGYTHTHDAPAPEPEVVLTVSLDKHRLPGAPPVPGPPPPGEADFGAHPEVPHTVAVPVETPPPLAHG